MNEEYAVRIVDIDYELCQPIGNLDICLSAYSGNVLYRVPVIRIFGILNNEYADKCCLWIHRVFPYLLVPFYPPNKHRINAMSDEQINAYLTSFGAQIENIINSVSKNAKTKKEIFYNLSVVHGIDFYGYHSMDEAFIKISLIDPKQIKRIVLILESGVINDCVYQPFEAHIPYLLHFLIDFNLYGMNFVHFNCPHFRQPVPTNHRIPIHLLSSRQIKRRSLCKYEIDAIAQNIVNIKWTKKVKIENADIDKIKLVPSLNDIWKSEKKRRERMKMSPSQKRIDQRLPSNRIESKYKKMLKQILDDEAAKTNKKKREKIRQRGKMYSDDLNVIVLTNPSQSQTNRSRQFSLSQTMSIDDDDDEQILNILDDLDNGSCDSLIIPQNAGNLTAALAVLEIEDVRGQKEENFSDFIWTDSDSENDEKINKDVVNQCKSPSKIEQEIFDIMSCSQVQSPISEVSEEQNDEDSNSVNRINEICKLPLFERKKRKKRSYIKSFDVQSNVKKRKRPKPKIEIDEIENEPIDFIEDEYEFKKPVFSLVNDSKLKFVESTTKKRKRSKIEINEFETMQRRKKRKLSNMSFDDCNLSPIPIKKQLKFDEDCKDNLNDTLCTNASSVYLSVGNMMQQIELSQTQNLSFSEYDETELKFEYFRQRNKECAIINVQSKPPSIEHLKSNICEFGESEFVHQSLYYSNEGDVEDGSRKNANISQLGIAPKPPTNLAKYLNEFVHDSEFQQYEKSNDCIQQNNDKIIIEYAPNPPSFDEINEWIQTNKKEKEKMVSPSLNETNFDNQRMSENEMTKCMAAYIVKCDENQNENEIDATSIFIDMDRHKGLKRPKLSECDVSDHTNQFLTILSVEIICENRRNLIPDPKFDAILCICAVIAIDDCICHEFILCNSEQPIMNRMDDEAMILSFDNEPKLLNAFVRLVHFSDADILIGFEVQKMSFGYLIDRALHIHADFDLNRLIKIRRKQQQNKEQFVDEWGAKKASGIDIIGRILLNLWRCSRSEIKLNNYTKENVTWNLLKIRIPKISYPQMHKMYRCVHKRSVIFNHLLKITQLNFDIICELDLIGRTSEMARIIGIDFFSVLSRGSQFRVESMLLRIAKPQNFVMISPSKDLVANQAAMECIPLVMEPRSLFYCSPLMVLDFQSLYPTMMIAYNIDYSTCLGKINGTRLGIKSVYKPDFTDLTVEDIWISPNGVMFLKKHKRNGIICRMVQELLETRIMTKCVMKSIKNESGNEKLYKLLYARQLSLKLICNVTYGYTSAAFSGRMPCAEIADSIVESGRECLERSIQIIEAHGDKKKKVIYGDTDSVFVLLPGVGLKKSFSIGRKLCSLITAMYPQPIKLEFEKVYFGALLLAKKRYVGYMYEESENDEAVIDAKGIEIIRRDSCPLVQNAMRRVLEILFKERNVSKVKEFLTNKVWHRVLSDDVPLSEYIFCKEVRIGTYRNEPPAAIVAQRKMMFDCRAFPLYAERVPYLVIYANPGSKLNDMVIDPLTFDATKHKINCLYYINKQINAAIGRILELFQIDIFVWFRNMKRPKIRRQRIDTAMTMQRGLTLDSFYLSKHCLLCDNLTKHKYFCIECRANPQNLCYCVSLNRLKRQKMIKKLKKICRKCVCGKDNDRMNIVSFDYCQSLDCPIWFEMKKSFKEYKFWTQIDKMIQLK